MNDIEMTFKYIKFGDPISTKSGKTKIWPVRANDGSVLGFIRWKGSWRGYAFYPEQGTIYAHDCLVWIADFCRIQTEYHRGERSKKGELF